MVLLEQYVTLYEKRWKNVFAGWKIFQSLIYFATALAGILCSFCLSNIVIAFQGNCLLFSNVTVERGEGKELYIDGTASDWGKLSYCLYCQYVPVCSVIFASVWLTFFTMCGRGGRSEHGLPQPWRIVYPAMIFNILYFLISVLAVVWYEEGYHHFCQSLMRNNVTDCKDLHLFSFKNTSGNEAELFLLLSRIGLWGNMMGWLFAAILLVVRCCFLADFTVVKITVVGATPIEEEAPKASPESAHFSTEENLNANLNVPPTL